ESIKSRQAKINLMINERMEKIKEFTYSSEMKQVKVDKETDNAEKLFSNLMGRVQEIQSKLKSNIDEKLQKSNVKVQAIIQELEEEIAALQRKHVQLEELSQNEDPLKLLQ
ncbi:hypothetical protein XENOCAPTIV_020376, partial [Xenoophorus captivus]